LGVSQGSTVLGTADFLMNGTYDPATGKVTGTFTAEQEATGTIKGSLGDLALDWSMSWAGEVRGSIGTGPPT